MTPTETKAPLPDEVEKALARAARNIGWLEALPPYGDNDTRKAAADDMCRALEELRARIAALEAENKRLRDLLGGANYTYLGDKYVAFLAPDAIAETLAQTDGKAGE